MYRHNAETSYQHCNINIEMQHHSRAKWIMPHNNFIKGVERTPKELNQDVKIIQTADV